MLKHLRPAATLIGLLAATVAWGAPAPGGLHPGAKIVTAPRFVPAAHGRFGVRHGSFGRHQRGRGAPWGGVDPTGDEPFVIPAPSPDAPQGGPPYVFESPAGNRPLPNPGPQIITLPDPPHGRSALRHHEHRPSWGGPEAAPRHVHRAPWRVAHHRHAHPWGFAPSFEPPPIEGDWSSLAMAPCGEGAHTPIYNTPCGVRPYQ